MFKLTLPLSVLNRTLELYEFDSESSCEKAIDSIRIAQATVDPVVFELDGVKITGFAQAVAEHLSQGIYEISY